MSSNWTTKDHEYIRKSALLDTSNRVVNIKQLAKHLSRTEKAVTKRVYLLREDGLLPQVDNGLALDAKGRNFTDYEKKQILASYKQNVPVADIADRFDRTTQSINSLIHRLKQNKANKISERRKMWSISKIDILLAHIRFDENGYVSNSAELARKTNMTVPSISRKISQLRKEGSISIIPDRTTTSIAAQKAHEKFNEARYASYPKERKDESMETPVVQQSKVIQVVLTIVKQTDGSEIHQYYSFEGSLLAEVKTKKTDSPAS